MMFAVPDPVPSGKPVDVIAVDGRTAHALADFVGEAVVTLHWQEQDRLVAGDGWAVDAESVRFIEKDVAHGGRDVRVWSIGPAAQPGHFVAWTTR